MPPVILYAPHADDETLSMGVDLAGHRLAGRDVVLVLVTAGASPWMLKVLNGDATDPVTGGVHSPVAEGYLSPRADGRLDVAQAAASRVSEFSQACGAYAAAGTGRFAAVVAGFDEGVSLEAVRGFATGLAARFPGALHQSMSWTDPHRDHAVCGQALRSLREEGVVPQALFSVQRGREDLARAAGLAVRPVVSAPGAADVVRRAAQAYRVWDPRSGRYGFGYRSVPASFDVLLADPSGAVHD